MRPPGCTRLLPGCPSRVSCRRSAARRVAQLAAADPGRAARERGPGLGLFRTYTCINWLRQLPYLRAWAGKYAGHGLVVIGVHTPEFPFEHDVG